MDRKEAEIASASPYNIPVSSIQEYVWTNIWNTQNIFLFTRAYIFINL